MGFKWFDRFSWGVGFFFSFVWVFLAMLNCYPLGDVVGYSVSGVFSLDALGYYLSLIAILLWVSLVYFANSMSRVSMVLLSVRILSSVLCFTSVHAF